MSRRLSPRVAGYLLFAVIALLASVWSGRPELVALAAVPLTLLVAGGYLARPPELSVRASFIPGRVLEAGCATLHLEVACGSHPARDVELRVRLPAALRAGEDQPSGWLLSLAGGERRELELELRAERWGAWRLDGVDASCWGPLRLFSFAGTLPAPAQLRAYPRATTIERLIDPAHRSTLVGNRVAGVHGPGIEFADVRAFRRGDRVRSVNWRVSARRQTLHINEQHPERNADVILLFDSFQDLQGVNGSTLDLALRAALALADGYLQQRDRVGVLKFGGAIDWLRPSSGGQAIYRIVETLIETSVRFSYTERSLSSVPRRLLPAGALIIALSPLLDSRIINALSDLRARGYDLALLECDPLTLLEEPTGEDERLARRLWAAERKSIRRMLTAEGVQCGVWRTGQPLITPLSEVISSRRHTSLRVGS